MCDENGGTVPHHAPIAFGHQALRDRIESGGWFVHDENGWVRQECPGQRDPLTLASRERQAAFPDHCLVAVRKGLDELCQPGRFRGPSHILVRRVRPHVADVFRQRRVQQHRLLLDEHDVATDLGEGEGAQVMPIQPHHAAIGIQEPRCERGNRRLAAPARAHQRQ